MEDLVTRWTWFWVQTPVIISRRMVLVGVGVSSVSLGNEVISGNEVMPGQLKTEELTSTY